MSIPTAQRGFTLLELLVSMTVLAVLLLILLSMVDSATQIWKQSEAKIDSYREARAALNTIVTDLSSMFTSRNPELFKLSPAGDKLNFIAAMPTAYQENGKNKSDLCKVGYFVNYRRGTTRSKEAYNLYRSFKNSNDTYTDLASTSFEFEDAPPDAELLARNILDFKVTPLSIDPTSGNASAFTSGTATPMPDMLVVRLTAISEEAAKRFKSKSDWSDTNSITYQQHARIFTVRVRLPSHGVNYSTTTGTSSSSNTR